MLKYCPTVGDQSLIGVNFSCVGGSLINRPGQFSITGCGSSI